MILHFQHRDTFVSPDGRLDEAALRRLNELIAQLNGLASSFAIQGSYPAGFTAPLIQADASGNVTIAAHTRYYGDGTSVAVAGGVLATGEAAASVLRIYYDDPRHLGGAVSYQYTLDPAVAPIQTGVRHIVGRVEIPASGTQDGTYLFPPGYIAP